MNEKTAQKKANSIMWAFNILCLGPVAGLLVLAPIVWALLGPKVRIIDSMGADDSEIANPYSDLPTDGPLVCQTSFIRWPLRFLLGKAKPEQLREWASRQLPSGRVGWAEESTGPIEWEFDEKIVKQAGLPERLAATGDKYLYLQQVDESLNHTLFINLSAGTFRFVSSGLDEENED